MFATARLAATSFVDALLGRGEHAVTVPPMDGALQPNNELERARSLVKVPSPDNLTLAGGQIAFSSGVDLLQLDIRDGSCHNLATFEAPVVALAALLDGGLAVALATGTIRLWKSGSAATSVVALGSRKFRAITAMLETPEDGLLVVEGSAQHSPDDWQRDLLLRQSSGSLWAIQVGGSRSECLASGLAYANGVAIASGGDFVVSESWRHSLTRIRRDGRKAVAVHDLPGYPGRLAKCADGGHWLAVFAPRSQLIEFVLREQEFKKRMMTEVDSKYWVAPALASGKDFREPLQGGAIKSMGILKPWAPTRSYGLLVKLNADFLPVASLHSRADGARHGVTSAFEVGSQLLIASKGGNEIVLADAF